MSLIEWMILGVRMWDINAQPTLFHRSFFEIWQDPPKDWSLDLLKRYFVELYSRHGQYFDGELNDVAIWTKGINEAMNLVIYNNGSPFIVSSNSSELFAIQFNSCVFTYLLASSLSVFI